MKQQTLAMAAEKGFEQFRRPTKRDVFLNMMDKILPWPEPCAVAQPHYPKGEGGRPPVGLERVRKVDGEPDESQPLIRWPVMRSHARLAAPRRH